MSRESGNEEAGRPVSAPVSNKSIAIAENASKTGSALKHAKKNATKVESHPKDPRSDDGSSQSKGKSDEIKKEDGKPVVSSVPKPKTQRKDRGGQNLQSVTDGSFAKADRKDVNQMDRQQSDAKKKETEFPRKDHGEKAAASGAKSNLNQALLSENAVSRKDGKDRTKSAEPESKKVQPRTSSVTGSSVEAARDNRSNLETSSKPKQFVDNGERRVRNVTEESRLQTDPFRSNEFHQRTERGNSAGGRKPRVVERISQEPHGMREGREMRERRNSSVSWEQHRTGKSNSPQRHVAGSASSIQRQRDSRDFTADRVRNGYDSRASHDSSKKETFPRNSQDREISDHFEGNKFKNGFQRSGGRFHRGSVFDQSSGRRPYDNSHALGREPFEQQNRRRLNGANHDHGYEHINRHHEQDTYQHSYNNSHQDSYGQSTTNHRCKEAPSHRAPPEDKYGQSLEQRPPPVVKSSVSGNRSQEDSKPSSSQVATILTTVESNPSPSPSPHSLPGGVSQPGTFSASAAGPTPRPITSPARAPTVPLPDSSLPSSVSQMMLMNAPVRFFIGGRMFEALPSTFVKYEECILNKLFSGERASVPEVSVNPRGEIFIDRDPYVFECLLAFCRSGVFYMPPHSSANVLRSDAKFFGLLKYVEPFLVKPAYIRTKTVSLNSNYPCATFIMHWGQLSVTCVTGNGRLLLNVYDETGNQDTCNFALYDSAFMTQPKGFFTKPDSGKTYCFSWEPSHLLSHGGLEEGLSVTFSSAYTFPDT